MNLFQRNVLKHGTDAYVALCGFPRGGVGNAEETLNALDDRKRPPPKGESL